MGKKAVAKKTRLSFNSYIMDVCHAVSKRSTCRHRDQGAVIVKGKRILATGYNGAPSGVKDCLERGFCMKTQHEDAYCLAEGLHGESNAIISAAKAGISIDGASIYCIYSPCRTCCNMIKNAGIMKVYYEQVYSNFPNGPGYLASMNVAAERLEEND